VHELSITRSVVAIAAEKAAGRKVSAVRLRIGRLAGIECDAIRFCFDLCAEGTSVQGAALQIDEVPGRARCGACGGERELSIPVLRCGCGAGAPMQVLQGEELLVAAIEVTDV
jgi:hydrogenase nickel incorporation protein HypA/HybF